MVYLSLGIITALIGFAFYTIYNICTGKIYRR